MADYHCNEAAFTVPDSAVDRSHTMLEIPAGDGKRISVVITRHTHDDRTLQDLVGECAQALAVSMRRYQATAAQFSQKSGFETARFTFSFLHETGLMFNALALVRLDDKFLNITVAGEHAFQERVEKVFDEILASIKYRRRR